ncbi:MAG: flagellin [Gammaproteobacteria bacterium]
MCGSGSCETWRLRCDQHFPGTLRRRCSRLAVVSGRAECAERATESPGLEGRRQPAVLPCEAAARPQWQVSLKFLRPIPINASAADLRLARRAAEAGPEPRAPDPVRVHQELSMQVINTNVMSLNAQRNLTTSQNSMSVSLQRLSSGLRINSAKDDAAGLAISERFTAQIRGLGQAQRNANDGISLAQTAEGALAQVTNNLQRVRELAVQSANATNSATDRAALQAEAAQLLQEIDRVASQTSFNGVKLLDGSFSSQVFQVGANSGDTISISSIVDSRTSRLGSDTLTADGTVTGNVVTAASGAVTNGIAAETDLTLTTSAGTTSAISYAANSGADAIASAINAAASGIGITATASNSATLSGLSSAGTVTFSLNNQAISVVVADKNDLTEVVNAINGVAGTTGVTATFSSSSSKSAITLSTTDGRNIELEDYTNSAGATESIVFGGTTLTEGTAVSAVKTGTVSLVSTKGAISTAGADATVFASAGVNNSTFTSVAGINISTVSGATGALATLDAALSQVNGGRADLGAIQNRFESVVANLSTAAENLSAARSRIQDADFAAETASLTRAQILQQAGTAMLAQANAAPQNVLSLLQG